MRLHPVTQMVLFTYFVTSITVQVLHVLAGCAQPTVPTVVVDTAKCIVDTIDADIHSGMPQEAAEIDAAAKCLGHYTVENKAKAHQIYMTRTADAGTE